jgi:peptidylprolyl isomerase
VRLPSGLVLQVLRPAKGTARPTPESRVTLHVTGWKANGVLVESTVMANHPATYDVSSVIPGWREGLLQMAEGEAVRLWIPAALAYGEKPRGRGIPAGDLVYDLELLSVH